VQGLTITRGNGRRDRIVLMRPLRFQRHDSPGIR
jgi:hypothetical protein